MYPEISDEFKNIIVASYFGDGTFSKIIPGKNKHSYLKISHGIKQADYAKWKANLFGSFANEPYIVNRTFRDKPYQCITFETKTHPFCTQLRECYFSGRKVIKNWMMSYLDPLALCIWYLDDGDFIWKRERRKDNSIRESFGGARISLGIYSEEECRLFHSALYERYNINSTIHLESGKYKRMYLNITEANKLFSIISPFVIESMKYKIMKQQVTKGLLPFEDIV